MPQRNVATNFTFEQQRVEINELASDFWTQKGTVDTALPTYLKLDGSNAFTGATLAVPNAFTINSNSGNGTVTISGNLDVTGTTTTVSSANLEVTDKNILIAKGSTSDAQADGAGITIDSSTDITFNFVDSSDALVSSIGLEATTHLKAARGQFTGATSPTTGYGVEINAPDANTGQIIAYNRDSTGYKELRLRASSVGVYTGTTNALAATFHSTGLTMESGKNINTENSVIAAGSITIAANSDIRMPNGSWTGDYGAKIQHHDNYLFLQGGSSGVNLRNAGGTRQLNMSNDGHFGPSNGQAYNLGSSALPWTNSYQKYIDVDTNDGTDNHTIANFNGLITSGNMAGLKIQYYACGSDDARAGLYWQHENVGNHRMWMDDAGVLRQKSSNPANDTDGEPYVRLGTTNTGNLTITGGIVQNDNSAETAFGNKSLPAADSGYYIRNGNGSTGTYASLGLIASSTAAASDQSASLVAKCTASGLSPEVYLTQRDGNNSQRNVIAINTLGDITVIGGVTPNSDNGQNLGSASKRWANVYTGDMHLNNMNTGGNDVDGSEGHWTMQEGSDDLFLINRNTGKKYKFNLTEVS